MVLVIPRNHLLDPVDLYILSDALFIIVIV